MVPVPSIFEFTWLARREYSILHGSTSHVKSNIHMRWVSSIADNPLADLFVTQVAIVISGSSNIQY
jgi:hypothetical protein